MSRRFINQLGEGESVDQVFLAGDKQLRSNRSGNLYLQARLSDRTGSVTAMMWNANDQISACFDNGDFVRVQGRTQFYNGQLQIILSEVDRIDPHKVHEEDFYHLSRSDIERLRERLREILRSIGNFHLRNLAECFLMDETFLDKFSRAPAGVKNHHAYQGGLLEHVVTLSEVVLAVAPNYPQVDQDLLVMGAFLHDVGKIDELTYERDLAYSDAGQLMGHLVMGVGILEPKIQQAAELSGEPFPQELALRLKHMIISHHGQYEHGSPRLPMTLEAIMLHQLDNLDAKIHSFHQLITDDANIESRWTPYHSSIGRKLFKGNGAT